MIFEEEDMFVCRGSEREIGCGGNMPGRGEGLRGEKRADESQCVCCRDRVRPANHSLQFLLTCHFRLLFSYTGLNYAPVPVLAEASPWFRFHFRPLRLSLPPHPINYCTSISTSPT